MSKLSNLEMCDRGWDDPRDRVQVLSCAAQLESGMGVRLFPMRVLASYISEKRLSEGYMDLQM